MPWVELLYDNSTAGEIYDIDEMRELFDIPPHEDGKPDLIPFIQVFYLTVGTAARFLQLQFNGPRKGLGSRGATIRLQGPGTAKEHRNGQITFIFGTELQMQYVPIGEAFKSAFGLISDGTGTWTINVKYILVEGNFLPDTELLERLADRRRMDGRQSDAHPNTRRMGKLRRMGDGIPGT